MYVNKLKISPYCSFTSNAQHSCFYTVVTVPGLRVNVANRFSDQSFRVTQYITRFHWAEEPHASARVNWILSLEALVFNFPPISHPQLQITP